MACKGSQGVSPAAPINEEEAKLNTLESEEGNKVCNDLFIDANSLSYNGYRIVKLKKKLRYEYSPEMKAKPDLIDVFYTVLKRNGNILAEFDGFYYGIGNSNDFGLFAFLGGKTKQLFITQAAPRSGRHWIVDLSTRFRVIFDSYEYQVGREEFWITDLDRDGVYEIIFGDPSFYMVFEGLSMAETPLPETIFKYDAHRKKYLPANHLFQGYALNGIEDEITKLKSEHEQGYLSHRLEILLRYIYAGKQDEGWAFFDKEYQLKDKEDVKVQVKEVLNKHPFYRFIYGRTRSSSRALTERSK